MSMGGEGIRCGGGGDGSRALGLWDCEAGADGDGDD